MKNIFIIGLFALVFIQACKKDENQELIDGMRPEERAAASLEKFGNELTSSTNGWVAYLETTLVGGAYNFYMSFDKENKVLMTVDYNSTVALSQKQSTYRLKQVMATSIIFDTYTLLHDLQNPDATVFNGNHANGYGSDFEFEFREQVGDTIKLVGKKRNALLTLIKATAEEKAIYTTDRFSNTILGINTFLSSGFTYILDPRDNSSKIQVNMLPAVRSRIFRLSFENLGEITTSTGLFSFSHDGALLLSPVKIGSNNYSRLFWDGTAKKLYLVAETGERLEILISQVPIMPLGIVMGVNFTSISAPNATTAQGWGTDFIARRASANTRMQASIVVGADRVSIGAIRFTFNSTSKTMNLIINAPFAATSLNLTYPYTFTRTATGVYKFTLGTITDANSTFVNNNAAKPLAPLLDERINTDTFVLDYFINSSGRVQGLIKSVENPTFILVGDLN